MISTQESRCRPVQETFQVQRIVSPVTRQVPPLERRVPFLGGELVQRHVILDILGDERTVRLRHRAKVARRKGRIGRQYGEVPTAIWAAPIA